jgi:hypothetical protein
VIADATIELEKATERAMMRVEESKQASLNSIREAQAVALDALNAKTMEMLLSVESSGEPPEGQLRQSLENFSGVGLNGQHGVYCVPGSC